MIQAKCILGNKREVSHLFRTKHPKFEHNDAQLEQSGKLFETFQNWTLSFCATSHLHITRAVKQHLENQAMKQISRK